MVSLSKIMKKGKAMFLAYDQGLEHGPVSDFNDKNVDPLYILNIAREGKFNAVVYQIGIAEKYSKEIRASKVPLILKLNGKTQIFKGEPRSSQLATVKDAVRLKAAAVGFTIYIGSKYEDEMLEEFAKIRAEAHKKGLPVVAWIYPRGEGAEKLSNREKLAYAARTGLEIGADIVKVHWAGTKKDLEFAVEASGRCKLVIAGGIKTTGKKFLKSVQDVIDVGGAGLAVGRNVWQNDKPLELSKEIKKVIFQK